MFKKTIRSIFPNSLIVDAALKFPITDFGWDVDCPQMSECRFSEPDFRLILNLQDMLAMNEGHEFPIELERIHATYAHLPNMKQLIVVVWPQGVAEKWNKRDSFHVVEFSTHQYETWKAYKSAENILRASFTPTGYEDNFLCMNRIDKPHRRGVVGELQTCFGNISSQMAGRELRYPGLSFNEYNNSYDNLKNLLTLKENFNTSLFSIITESQYAERYGIVTEKTFNAIVAGHPFLVVGHKHILQNIRELGFKTFPEFFNEDYDDIDNITRIGVTLYNNYSYMDVKLTEVEMHDMRTLMQQKINFNRDYFFDGFGKYLTDKLERQLLSFWAPQNKR